MNNPKKFGTFGGVFTPAILTILGVIMYMRLPWIVGQAGLYNAIGIILVAHIIAVTTGLSVASISTDKRVKGGGTYYMISRSLGLPIGGTLGLALYVGLSFSVSLYLIGFSESFLGFWGFEVSKSTIQLSGSIALFLVTVITLISTNLALKTQFFILLAIILSLGSIFLGTPQTIPKEPLLHPIAGGASFIVLFGIFFPAVTGFEAGVSMSGDLKDSKRSIPVGTIAAIFVGLVVYISMAVFFSYRISSEQLIKNPNVLLDNSFFSPLVVAGIWGATLSSAMGSILGAPRILQAISQDRITPKIFGRGYGKENEPRNALLLTFAMAEAGILIGELDVIARVVSMFFITTYGFLNMSCVIENWASPDFQPEFKTPQWLSTIGAVTCLVVMIQLDLLAMIGATILLTALFLYLKRKELTLESGDTWEGVWSSIIRKGLVYLNQHIGQKRNWRPNIILFSGGSELRPYLVDLGKHLVDKRGIISNFDLIEMNSSLPSEAKSEQAITNNTEEFSGVFYRRITCNDVYSTMETVSRYYGFSGLEPNSILMGWGRNSQKPEKFIHLIKSLVSLDYNLMFLDYDNKRGFGNRQRIDIWWRKTGDTVGFSFSLCRYLLSSDEWRSTKLRFLAITEDSSLTEKLLKTMNTIVSDFRLEVSVKVINNAIEKKAFYDIVTHESGEADLTMLPIPHIPEGEEQIFISKINAAIGQLGTVLLIQSSSFFKEMVAGVEEIVKPAVKKNEEQSVQLDQVIELGGLKGAPANAVSRLNSLILTLTGHFNKAHLQHVLRLSEIPLENLRKRIETSFGVLEKELTEKEHLKNYRILQRVISDFLFHTHQIFSNRFDEEKKQGVDILNEGIHWVMSRIVAIPKGIPERIYIERNPELLTLTSVDSFTVKLSKITKKLKRFIQRKPAVSKIRFRDLGCQYAFNDFLHLFYTRLETFSIDSLKLYPQIQKLIDHVQDSFGQIGKRIQKEDGFIPDILEIEKDRIYKELDELSQTRAKFFDRGNALLMSDATRLLNGLIKDINAFDSHRNLKSGKKITKTFNVLSSDINQITEVWAANQDVMLKTIVADLILLSFINRISVIIQRFKDHLRLTVRNTLATEFQTFSTFLEEFIANGMSVGDGKKKSGLVLKEWAKELDVWEHMVNEIRGSINELPEIVSVVYQDHAQSNFESNNSVIQSSEMPLRRWVEFQFESNLIGPVGDEFVRLLEQFNKNIRIGQDVNRLISIGFTDDEGQTAPETIRPAAIEALQRVTDARESIDSALKHFEENLNVQMKNTFEELNLYSLSGSFDLLDKKTGSIKKLNIPARIRIRMLSIFQGISELSTRFLYRRSNAVSFLKALEFAIEDHDSDMDHLMEFVELSSPPVGTLGQLPFYYKHLFLGKPVITKEFWVSRQNEMQEAGKAVKRFQTGYSGGLVIIGEPGSGKTSLANMVATRYFEKQRIFQLNPPEEGSIDVDYFNIKLKEVFNTHDDMDYFLHHIQENSVLIIDNIERWWERSEHGLAVLYRIKELILKLENRCLLIATANSPFFRFINRLMDFKSSFLDIVVCRPLDVESLQKITMLRHRSIGLEFVYKGRSKEQMTNWQMARLFTRLYVDCQGNISVAMRKWVTGIRNLSKEGFEIILPPSVDKKALKHLTLDQLILIVQFVLHDRLNYFRLTRIMELNEEKLKLHLEALIRCRILIVKTNGVLHLNPFIQPYLLTLLTDKGLI